MLLEDLSLLSQSLFETLYMVVISGCVSIFFGTGIALALFLSGHGQMCENKKIHAFLNMIVVLGRSIPFIILMIALIPLTRIIIGTAVGTTAAIVPLSIGAIPFFARILEGKLQQLPSGIFIAAQSMGLTVFQVIKKIVLPEMLPYFMNCVTILLVTLIEYSTMAGAIGGGGLGSTALQYGYYQFNTRILLEALVCIVLLVLTVQSVGDKISKYFSYPT